MEQSLLCLIIVPQVQALNKSEKSFCCSEWEGITFILVVWQS